MKNLAEMLCKFKPGRHCRAKSRRRDGQNRNLKGFEKIIDHLQTCLDADQMPRNPRFVFGKTLGTGAFGRVRLVNYIDDESSHKLNMVFAIKTIKFEKLKEDKELEHLKGELDMLKSVDHPFIVKMYGNVRDRNAVHILMDYVIGGELFTKLKEKGRFSKNEAVFYSAEVVEAIDYLHKNKIIYRDIKMENILIDQMGHIKLVDFGFAKRLGDGQTNTLCGTTEYLAPETMAFNGYGKSADWWSLGVLIYEMLTGGTPFHGNTIAELRKSAEQEEIYFPYFVDAVSQDIILKFLNVNVTTRLGSRSTEDIKLHPFFKGIKWNDLVLKKVRSPSIPVVSGRDDTRYFEEFTESETELMPSQSFVESMASDSYSSTISSEFNVK